MTRKRCWRFGLALWMAAPLAAQPIQLKFHSEFQRIDPFGQILAVDRAERPREILSPAVARGGYASFHLAVTVPAGTPFRLYLGQNPDSVFRLTLYRERFRRVGATWFPDELVRVLEPYDSRAQPAEEPIAGQTTTVFWLDIWTPAEAAVRRVRLEAQLNVGEHWVIAPLEVRIRPVRIPDHAPPSDSLPDIEAPADRAALGPLLRYLCGRRDGSGAAPLSVRRMIRRNAAQDMALAALLEARLGREAVRQRILQIAGAADATEWCERPETPRPLGAEWYLRLRDYLLQALE